MAISEVGIYTMSAEEYHADCCVTPSLSSSIARILVNDSPRHAYAAHPRLNPDWAEPDGERHLDLGSLCHALMLEGEDRSVVIEAENYRTKASQQARDDARAAGKYPILAHEMPAVHSMMAACREQIQQSEIPDAFTNGKPEQTIVWKEPNEIWCRARMDWLMTAKPVILDYKTSARSAKPQNLSRIAASNGWCIQSSFYRRGFKAVFGLDARFVFVCQENFAPFALSLMECSPADEALADAQVEYAIDTFGDCLESGIWPGYSQRVERITSPVWIESAWMERELEER